VEQENVPVWQGLLLGLQFPPEEQEVQAPFLQTCPLWQTLAVPSATFELNWQTWEPVEQENVPVWQGLLLGLQFPPEEQAVQSPFLQTCPLGQPVAVPLATFELN
jgi:hypothetical protein